MTMSTMLQHPGPVRLLRDIIAVFPMLEVKVDRAIMRRLLLCNTGSCTAFSIIPSTRYDTRYGTVTYIRSMFDGLPAVVPYIYCYLQQ